MNVIKDFFVQHKDFSQLLIYGLLITSLWFTEFLYSIDGLLKKWKHSATNIFFIFTALPIQLCLTGFIIVISDWAVRHHWGLINYIPFHQNKWLYYIVMFMILDLCEYVYHVIMHKADFLWKFHLVHHSDLRVDVSTTLREHPGETFVRTGFLMLWVFIWGPAVSVLLLRQFFQTFSNILAHTEFRLPHRTNKIIGLFFITPNLHHVHHHYKLPYTDRNYGDVLSIWDRLFNTYAELDEEDTVFGIDTHMNEAVTGKFTNVLKVPFQKLVRNRDH